MEIAIVIAIWIAAIWGIRVMRRLQPENTFYVIWAIIDAFLITLLMFRQIVHL